LLASREPKALDGVKVEAVGSIPPRMLRSDALRRLPAGLFAARGSVSYRESVRLMQTADVLMTIDAPARYSVFFPSKLVDYIGAGRQLLGIVPPGAARRIIESCGGATISPTAPVEALAAFLMAEITKARSRKRAGSTSAVSKEIAAAYAIDTVARQFDELCQATAVHTRDAAA
jgi:hypothetical protein